jgi:hypothetical protein
MQPCTVAGTVDAEMISAAWKTGRSMEQAPTNIFDHSKEEEEKEEEDAKKRIQ